MAEVWHVTKSRRSIPPTLAATVRLMKSANSSDWRCRIGLLVPHFDLVPEFEFSLMAPAGTSVHAARVLFGVTQGATVVGTDAARAFADGPYIDEAVELLSAAPVEVIVYGFTSSSYFTGFEADEALKTRLEAHSGGVPVVVPCLAAVSALRKLGIGHLALVHPPWFPVETDELGARYFQNQGFDVVCHAPAEIEFGELPRGQIEMRPDVVCEWVAAHFPDHAEGVLIGGNGFRSVEAIGPLEEALGRPVLTANQVALWQALNLSGAMGTVSGYGRLLEHI